MKCAAGVLIVVLAPWAATPPRVPPTTPSLAIPPSAIPETIPNVDLDASGQEWLADPVLPTCFEAPDPGLDPVEVSWPDEALTQNIPPLESFAAWQDLGTTPSNPTGPESGFPKGIGAPEVATWQAEDERRQIREFASEALLGVPMLVPQLILEALLPRGIAIGPTTFLYRTNSAPSSLSLVVLDQILFHQTEFIASMQSRGMEPGGYPSSELEKAQRRVVRRSLMGGFRASYAVPGLTMDLVLQTASDHGIAGYLLAPPIGGAVLYFKGIDQKIRLHENVRLRCKVASGREWVEGVRSDDGTPVMSFELRFCDFPVGLIASFDASSQGVVPAFIGIGTSLDAVEDLLGAETAIRDPSFRPR